ncbi:MAG: hypothetical protein ABSH19_01185 [Opitutales bacterium]
MTLSEFQEWTGYFNLRVESNRDLLFPKELTKIMSVFPKNTGKLFAFSTSLVDWLPRNIERAMYLSSWETYPPDQMVIMKKFRLGCGESRNVIDAPAHLFESQPIGNRYDMDEPARLGENRIVQESAEMAGLIFLAITFQWQGYILAKNCLDHIYLGDEFIVFHSDDSEKLKVTHELLAAYKLKVIQDAKAAW